MGEEMLLSFLACGDCEWESGGKKDSSLFIHNESDEESSQNESSDEKELVWSENLTVQTSILFDQQCGVVRNLLPNATRRQSTSSRCFSPNIYIAWLSLACMAGFWKGGKGERQVHEACEGTGGPDVVCDLHTWQYCVTFKPFKRMYENGSKIALNSTCSKGFK